MVSCYLCRLNDLWRVLNQLKGSFSFILLAILHGLMLFYLRLSLGLHCILLGHGHGQLLLHVEVDQLDDELLVLGVDKARPLASATCSL